MTSLKKRQASCQGSCVGWSFVLRRQAEGGGRGWSAGGGSSPSPSKHKGSSSCLGEQRPAADSGVLAAQLGFLSPFPGA